MPYIKPEVRACLDPIIDDLVAAIIEPTADQPEMRAGMLNYCITRLAIDLIPERRYWAIALISGALHNTADEFYRRYAIPYEEEQIAKNGDVY